MNRLRSAAVFVVFLAAAGVAQGQDFKQRFVGKSPCANDIQSALPDFSLRLDKTQDLTLLYRDLSRVKIVMIVQPNDSADHCGVIRDVVQITHIAKDFEFRCFDPHAPTDVIVGTAIRNGSTKPVTAIDVWRVDLKEQKFIETADSVTCSAEGWAGDDDGGDLVEETMKYAAHHRPGVFASEQPVLSNGTSSDSYAQKKKLRFEEYLTTETFSSAAHAPILDTPFDRKYRTAIREGLVNGANFAGRYVVVKWGCGTGCTSFVIVDAKTGIVYDPPFHSLDFHTPPKDSDVQWWFYPERLNYRKESRLLIIEGCLAGRPCGRTYFEMTNTLK
jgi:hypothetical protein